MINFIQTLYRGCTENDFAFFAVVSALLRVYLTGGLVMIGNDVFVAFPNKNTALAVAKTAMSAGFNVACAVLSANALRQKLGYYDGGIVICGCRFSDANINELLQDIPETFGIILIGTPDMLNNCDCERAVKLAVPINTAQLVCYMDMLRPEPSNAHRSRSPEDRAIIDKAKRFLINHYNMTEPQAHKYLEKKSMETGRTLAETAKRILN